MNPRTPVAERRVGQQYGGPGDADRAASLAQPALEHARDGLDALLSPSGKLFAILVTGPHTRGTRVRSSGTGAGATLLEGLLSWNAPSYPSRGPLRGPPVTSPSSSGSPLPPLSFSSSTSRFQKASRSAWYTESVEDSALGLSYLASLRSCSTTVSISWSICSSRPAIFLSR